MAQRPILDESSVALTFDDVLLVPRPSDVLPAEVNVGSRVTREISVKTTAANALTTSGSNCVPAQTSSSASASSAERAARYRRSVVIAL